MKVEKTVEFPARREQRLAYIKCELCEARTNAQGYWAERVFDVNEPDIILKVRLEEGYSYPEDYSTDTLVLDICPKCFKEKLVPWFVSQGGQPRTEK